MKRPRRQPRPLTALLTPRALRAMTVGAAACSLVSAVWAWQYGPEAAQSGDAVPLAALANTPAHDVTTTTTRDPFADLTHFATLQPPQPLFEPAMEEDVALGGSESAQATLPGSDTPASDAVMFNGRALRKAQTLRMLTTAYSPDERSCGKWADGRTASGYSVWTNGMKLAAADTRLLPFGTIISIPGYNGGKPVPVLDRGGKIKGHRLDLLYPTHEIARRWGAQRLDVVVWEYADE